MKTKTRTTRTLLTSEVKPKIFQLLELLVRKSEAGELEWRPADDDPEGFCAIYRIGKVLISRDRDDTVYLLKVFEIEGSRFIETRSDQWPFQGTMLFRRLFTSAWKSATDTDNFLSEMLKA